MPRKTAKKGNNNAEKTTARKPETRTRKRKADADAAKEDLKKIPKTEENIAQESSESPLIPMDLFATIIIPELGKGEKIALRSVNRAFRDLMDSKFLLLSANLYSCTKASLLKLPPNLHTLKTRALGFEHTSVLPENLKCLDTIRMKDREFIHLPETLETLIIRPDDARFKNAQWKTSISEKKFKNLPQTLKTFDFYSDSLLDPSEFKDLPPQLKVLRIQAKCKPGPIIGLPDTLKLLDWDSYSLTQETKLPPTLEILRVANISPDAIDNLPSTLEKVHTVTSAVHEKLRNRNITVTTGYYNYYSNRYYSRD